MNTNNPVAVAARRAWRAGVRDLAALPPKHRKTRLGKRPRRRVKVLPFVETCKHDND